MHQLLVGKFEDLSIDVKIIRDAKYLCGESGREGERRKRQVLY